MPVVLLSCIISKLINAVSPDAADNARTAYNARRLDY